MFRGLELNYETHFYPVFWNYHLDYRPDLGDRSSHGSNGEVPKPNMKGDFITAKVQGNRGLYNNINWLVVDPEYLNCRNTPEGTVKARLESGAMMTALFSNDGKGDAIVLKNGQSWLKVESIHPYELD